MKCHMSFHAEWDVQTLISYDYFLEIFPWIQWVLTIAPQVAPDGAPGPAKPRREGGVTGGGYILKDLGIGFRKQIAVLGMFICNWCARLLGWDVSGFSSWPVGPLWSSVSIHIYIYIIYIYTRSCSLPVV